MDRASVQGEKLLCQSSELHSHIELYHKQPSTQYSGTNAWNLNNNGNMNNNNKYNRMYAVPLAESNGRDADIGGYIVPIGEIYDAYYECLKNKARTLNAMLFTLNLEQNIRKLWQEINGRNYEIGKSIAFIVEHPVKREVFAANFRDRIVHVWICQRLIPLIEEYLPDSMASNRVGKGTLYAINKLFNLIKEKSNGYTEDCWIWKFDLQGFFMSIDKRLLNKKVQHFIDERYNAPDKFILKWLAEKVIMHCPQLSCIRKSKPCAWVGLRKDKSLFTQDKYHGMPIGNLPSQILANFLLSDMIFFMRQNGFSSIQYVDDNATVDNSKERILAFIPILRKWLWEELGITLHPRKCYIQHYTKGVAFVGGIVKPYRVYISKRSYRKALGKTHWLVITKAELPEVIKSVNSYLGLTRHFSAFKLREKIAGLLFPEYGEAISFSNNYDKLIINKKWQQI